MGCREMLDTLQHALHLHLMPISQPAGWQGGTETVSAGPAPIELRLDSPEGAALIQGNVLGSAGMRQSYIWGLDASICGGFL